MNQDPAAAAVNERRGRPVLALAAYLAAVFVAGPLLAPWIWRAVQALAPDHPVLHTLAHQSFARYVNRCLLLVALVGLPFFIRGAGIRGWGDIGFDPRHIRWRRFLAGFGLGFFSLATVCMVAVAVGGRVLDTQHSAARIAGGLVGAMLTALIVAVMEELLFRGAMFGGLRRAIPWPAALAVSSAVYAIVHFLGKPAKPSVMGWDAGLRVLPGMLRGFGDVNALVPAFFSLALAGVVLGLAYHWTGDLFASMGIHAGWIFWLKSYGALTSGAPGADVRIWGTERLVDGWFAFAMLVVVLAALLLGVRGRNRGGPMEVAEDGFR
jgi:membrane protease YdiL (CAAX protease family)